MVRQAVINRLRYNPMPPLHQNQPKGFKKDRKSFDELGVLLPSKEFAERRGPSLVALLEKYHAGSKDATKALDAHINANWFTNLTLIDFDHVEATWGGAPVPDERKVPSIETDPLELASALPPTAMEGGVLDMVGSFFESVSAMVVRLSGRLMIEALVGEMTDVLDRIRWGCLGDRSQPCGDIDPSKFPRIYDRIHMSNIP